MADSFMDSLWNTLGELLSPRDAEGKVIAGDPEAANLIARAQSQFAPEATDNRTVLRAAERNPHTVTVYSSSKKRTPPFGIPAGQMNEGGLYFDQKIYLNPNVGTQAWREMALRHELGHFLDAATPKYPEGAPRGAGRTQSWIDWLFGFSQQSLDNASTRIRGFSDEQMADALTNSSGYPPYDPKGADLESLYKRLKFIYGTTHPFDREAQ